jgi:chromosome segregation ATPase
VVLLAGYSAWKASLRREAALGSERRQAQAEISRLLSQVSQARNRVSAGQAHVQELEARQAELARNADKLRARLAELQTAQQKQVARLATLPLPALSSELQSHLAPQAVKLETGNAKFSGGGQAPNFPLAVSAEGGRQIAASLQDLKSCREQAEIEEQQYQNCRASLTNYAALSQQQAQQTRDLKQALDAQRQAYEARDQLAQEELKAARGSWVHRLASKAKWFGVGLAVGTVAALAAK